MEFKEIMKKQIREAVLMADKKNFENFVDFALENIIQDQESLFKLFNELDFELKFKETKKASKTPLKDKKKPKTLQEDIKDKSIKEQAKNELEDITEIEDELLDEAEKEIEIEKEKPKTEDGIVEDINKTTQKLPAGIKEIAQDEVDEDEALQKEQERKSTEQAMLNG